jgi:hypothetical protein
MYSHAKRPGEITGETLAGMRAPVDSTREIILPEHSYETTFKKFLF